MCYHHHHLITSVVTSAAIFRKLTHVVIQLAQLSARTHTVVPNYKNPPKIKSWKFVKLTDHTCACNNLTSFVYKPHPPENKNSCKFVAGFNYLEPLCPSAPGSDKPVCGCDSWELFSFPSSSFIVVCYLSLFFPLDSINKQHTIVSPESQKPSSWTPTTIALPQWVELNFKGACFNEKVP